MNTNTALIVPSPSHAASTAVQLNFKDGLKPLIAIPNTWLWVISIALLLALAAGVWLALRSWRRKAAIVPVVPPLPPHVRARRALEAALSLISDPKAFSIAVSDAIRAYLEERFDFRAPERTTEEFLIELRATDLLTPDQKISLGEFLNGCDLIKFARYEPTENELRALHAAAMKLVNETEPRWAPAAAQTPVAAP